MSKVDKRLAQIYDWAIDYDNNDPRYFIDANIDWTPGQRQKVLISLGDTKIEVIAWNDKWLAIKVHTYFTMESVLRTSVEEVIKYIKKELNL